MSIFSCLRARHGITSSVFIVLGLRYMRHRGDKDLPPRGDVPALVLRMERDPWFVVQCIAWGSSVLNTYAFVIVMITAAFVAWARFTR